MTNDNLVLEQLRLMRNEMRDHRRSTDAGFKDLRERLTSMETRLVSLEMQILAQHADTTRHTARFDALQDRIERIERRLELGTAMTDDNIIIKHLQAIRTTLDEQSERLSRVETRLSSIEGTLGYLYAGGEAS